MSIMSNVDFIKSTFDNIDITDTLNENVLGMEAKYRDCTNNVLQ